VPPIKETSCNNTYQVNTCVVEPSCLSESRRPDQCSYVSGQNASSTPPNDRQLKSFQCAIASPASMANPCRCIIMLRTTLRRKDTTRRLSEAQAVSRRSKDHFPCFYPNHKRTPIPPLTLHRLVRKQESVDLEVERSQFPLCTPLIHLLDGKPALPSGLFQGAIPISVRFRDSVQGRARSLLTSISIS
jgi:hypothetical protein